MSAEFFLDTNILIYANDPADAHKHAIARDLVRKAMREGSGRISAQVVQECLNFMLRKAKIPLHMEEAVFLCKEVLEPLCPPLSHFALCYDALHIKERWKYGFYDALIIAAALKLDCKILYSEDLQHNQRIEKLTIRNPFHE